ncbi:hypothetical protein CCMSSC00406_0000368 [Pleurotus cornucopiae]|uniref:Uncharacterized protein n=1 Tax=Pleurotus cornucopiae TaxID=5321 RepID=A0ACB7J049_PLECO|nr:hypothetical protein CCMSSC00406_0000368 [Pleurotus cornucopiae]
MRAVEAFQLVNGQMVTDGFSIINSPQPNTPVHDNIVISVDVSSNGKLQPPSAIDSLEIYLVSDALNVNVTVTAGPGFLQGEQGSTVKHLNFRPPPCARDGDYNLTFYEASHNADGNFFVITAIPVRVDQTQNSPTACNANDLQVQPQASSPPPGGNPFLASNSGVSAGQTRTQLFPSMTYQGPSDPTMTLVLVSQVATITEQSNGPATTEIEVSTTTIMTLTDLSRFLPVSGAQPNVPSLSMLHFVLAGAVVVYRLMDHHMR